ncbi:hypothetical protein SASPL_114972 [Salvia splendens]|uniref:PI4-kinase N-terminal domain-containing protein n=1 Tax=Salvia splendens TaxID=180675 RepID=A0A8X8Y4P4_SALSN|nr:hypothetical protein SASPL_114972 [Salvia splendens]
MGLATSIRERNDYEGEDGKEKPATPPIQMNIIHLLAELNLLDAVSRMASLGFEKSYREAVVLMTRSYMGKLSDVGSAESKTQAPEATAERIEISVSYHFAQMSAWRLSPKVEDFDPCVDIEPSILCYLVLRQSQFQRHLIVQAVWVPPLSKLLYNVFLKDMSFVD